MIRLIRNPVYLINGKDLYEVEGRDIWRDFKGNLVNPEIVYGVNPDHPQEAHKNTIAYQVLDSHNCSGDKENLKIRFDALTSHDITYVGIVQTARASGLTQFPLPYVLTNCHNSLCAVGGTINEDDHVFGLSAAQKYGGIYVPAHQAVIHQYMREMMTRCGSMIMGSDSHTRYGALGTMGIGEGGPELVKQILNKTYDIHYPDVIAVYLSGKPRPGVGPQDVALAIIGAVFKEGFATNKVLEFVGPGIANLSVDFRNGVDVMTTETTCLSSIWVTDEKVREFFEIHGRPQTYNKLEPGQIASYEGAVIVDLDKIEPMIALPFHPSNVYPISVVNCHAYDILKEIEKEGKKQLDNPAIDFSLTNHLVNGKLKIDQAIIAGCAGGTFENIMETAAITDRLSVGNEELAFSVYPSSQPIYLKLVKNGAAAKLFEAGIVIKTAFCGPCFGAGDVPFHGSLSIRHTTRNFPNREGSKPGEGQISSVALMDARSIAATVVNGGLLTPATDLDYDVPSLDYQFDDQIYAKRVYNGFGDPKWKTDLKFGPNIADWPKMISLPENIILKVAAAIYDPVTTTDELIPSGETSSFRSNPNKLAEFTLSRKDPQYVPRAKGVQALELLRQSLIEGSDNLIIPEELLQILEKVNAHPQNSEMSMLDFIRQTGIGTVVFAVKPGDGSAREQAASCQKVLGGWANIAYEYATKRYRSNLINWGMLPFTMDRQSGINLAVDDYIWIPDIRQKIIEGQEIIREAQVVNTEGTKDIELKLINLTKDERDIILSGSLINYYGDNRC